MPLIDMPLEKLHQYEGRNPRPDDVDRFWDEALAEMHALDPQVELVPHEIDAPFAECFHLYFTGTGGARVHAKYLRPKNAAQPHPALLQFHGYSGSSGDWHDKLGWVGRGFSVASLDCRGQGGLSNDVGGTSGNTLRGHIIRGLQDALDGDPHKFYFRHVFLDTALLARIVKSFDEVDENRIGATGGSQGGALTLACAALAPEVKRAAPIFPFLCDYLRVWEMDLDVSAYEELRTWFRNFDPRHEKHDDVFRCLGYIDNQHLAHRIQGEILMPVGLMDSVCPPSTQFAAYNKITAPKNLLIYPDFGHEGLPGSGDAIWNFMGGL